MSEPPPQVDDSQSTRSGWRRWLPRFSLRGVLVLQAVVAALLAVSYWWPKSEQLRIFAVPSNRNMGFYRGLGLVDGPGFFGRDYYRFKITRGEPAEDTSVEVWYDGDEYGTFRGLYPDGSVREEGTCRIEIFDHWWPLPMIGEVKDARYYMPDGKLGSEVIRGTGRATIWTFDGAKVMEWEVDSGHVVSETRWDKAGNVTEQWTGIR